MERQEPPVITDSDKDKIAARLRSEARRVGVRQTDIAYTTGVDRQAVNHWFHARNFPDFASLWKLCRAYGVSADYLMFGTRESDPTVMNLARRIAALNSTQRDALARLFNAPAEDSKVEAALGRPKR